MKPYSDRGNFIPVEIRFNFALTRIRVVVDNELGRLKGLTKCIAKRLDTTIEHSLNIVTTCCILHNFYIITKQMLLHKWLQQKEFELVQNRNTSECLEAVNEAESIRNAIKDLLAHL